MSHPLIDRIIKIFKASSTPTTDEYIDFAENQRAQFQLIDYYASQYRADFHNVGWFQQNFDLPPALVETLYKEHRAAQPKSSAHRTILFTEALFETLQKLARNTVTYTQDGDAAERYLTGLAACFHAARYHGHSKALLNGDGDANKQRRHTVHAADAMNTLLASCVAQGIISADESRDMKTLGLPGQRFTLPETIALVKKFCTDPATAPAPQPPKNG